MKYTKSKIATYLLNKEVVYMKIKKTVLIDDKGVSEIIGVILIFGILVLFLGILQSISVPGWNREIEAAHFNIIYDDILDLRQVMQETAIFNLTRTTVLHVNIDYPTRIFLHNPPKPGATISTYNDKKISVNYSDGNPPVYYNSCTIKIKENYNYFSAPELIIEHGMIIGNNGHISYTIDEPLMNNKTIDLYLVECSNNSFGTTSSMNIHLFPVMISDISVNNASIEFTTEYKELWDNYRNLTKIDKDAFYEFPDQITMKYGNATRIRVFITSIKV